MGGLIFRGVRVQLQAIWRMFEVEVDMSAEFDLEGIVVTWMEVGGAGVLGGLWGSIVK